MIDPARVPTAPIKGPKNIVLAAVAGLFAGFLISLLAVILITGAELRAAAEVRARRLDDERESARHQVASRGAAAPALLSAAGPEPPLELVDFPPPPPAPPQVDPPARPRAVAPAPAPSPRPVVVPPPVEPAPHAAPPAAEVETRSVERVPVEAPLRGGCAVATRPGRDAASCCRAVCRAEAGCDRAAPCATGAEAGGSCLRAGGCRAEAGSDGAAPCATGAEAGGSEAGGSEAGDPCRRDAGGYRRRAGCGRAACRRAGREGRASPCASGAEAGGSCR